MLTQSYQCGLNVFDHLLGGMGRHFDTSIRSHGETRPTCVEADNRETGSHRFEDGKSSRIVEAREEECVVPVELRLRFCERERPCEMDLIRNPETLGEALELSFERAIPHDSKRDVGYAIGNSGYRLDRVLNSLPGNKAANEEKAQPILLRTEG